MDTELAELADDIRAAITGLAAAFEGFVAAVEAALTEEPPPDPDPVPGPQLAIPQDWWPVGIVERDGPGHEEAGDYLAEYAHTGPSLGLRSFVKGTAPVEIRHLVNGHRRCVVTLDHAHRSGDPIPGPVIGSSGVVETYNELPNPARTLTIHTRVSILDEGPDWPGVVPKYTKLVGAKIWGGDWSDHPGGFTTGPASASVRIVVWNYDDNPAQAGFGLRVYRTPDFPAAPIGYNDEDTPVAEWPVGGAEITEYLSKFARSTWAVDPRDTVTPGEWYDLTLRLTANTIEDGVVNHDGQIVLWIGDRPALTVDDLVFVSEPIPGQDTPMWNWAGLTTMIGGSDPSILPATPNQGVKVAFDRFEVE